MKIVQDECAPDGYKFFCKEVKEKIGVSFDDIKKNMKMINDLGDISVYKWDSYKIYNEIGIWTIEYSFKILILGHARHGKDTVSNILCEKFNLKSTSSSLAALDIFIFDILNKKYARNYQNKQEAFEDRINIRDIWFDEISEYNRDDKTRLAKEILKTNDIYTGLRSAEEVEQCIKEGVFDLIFGVYDYRKPHESTNSNTADIFKYSKFIIMNNGDLEDLREKVLKLFY